MGDIRAVVHGLYETVKERLNNDVLFVGGEETATALPKFDIHQLFDNAAEMTEDWSFLQDTRNVWEVNGERWMWDRLFKEQVIKRRFISEDMPRSRRREDMVWNERGIEDWFRAVRRFKEELFVLVHLTGGAPARGTEIISIQHENGASSRTQRGIFVDRGTVQFVTSYHKGYSASQQVKIIHRFVPREVGELVIYFL